MSALAIYKKTTAGEEEIIKRILNLPLKLRSLLISIDGKKSSDELEKAFASFGDVRAMLAALEEKSCIERVPDSNALKEPARPASAILNLEARDYAAQYLYNALGPESDSLVRRVEKCRNNDDLSKVFDECRELLVAMGKPKKATEFWTRGKEMLSL